MSVLFPAPFEPRSPKISPFITSKEMSFTATTVLVLSLKTLEMWSIRMIGVPSATTGVPKGAAVSPPGGGVSLRNRCRAFTSG